MTHDVYIGEMPSVENILPGGILGRSQLIMYAEIHIQDLGDFVYKDEPVFFRQEKSIKTKVVSNCREHIIFKPCIQDQPDQYISLAGLPEILRTQIIEVIEDQVNSMEHDEIKEICQDSQY